MRLRQIFEDGIVNCNIFLASNECPKKSQRALWAPTVVTLGADSIAIMFSPSRKAVNEINRAQLGIDHIKGVKLPRIQILGSAKGIRYGHNSWVYANAHTLRLSKSFHINMPYLKFRIDSRAYLAIYTSPHSFWSALENFLYPPTTLICAVRPSTLMTVLSADRHKTTGLQDFKNILLLSVVTDSYNLVYRIVPTTVTVEASESSRTWVAVVAAKCRLAYTSIHARLIHDTVVFVWKNHDQLSRRKNS